MEKVIDEILKGIIRWAYPQFRRPKGYTSYRSIFIHYFILQKIIGFNRQVPWPVHFTSMVRGWEHIEKGICCDPGDSPGIYINAYGGLKFGDDIEIGANTTITTTNHNKYDYRKEGFKKGIVIGNHVWIGSNCCITAGVTIGDNVTIGAGCVIRQDIPSNTTVVSKSADLELIPKRAYEWDCTREELM